MYKIGIIDDTNEQFENYLIRIRRVRPDIELQCVTSCVSCDDVVSWIFDNKIECLIVDYQLDAKYSFTGTELTKCINNSIRDFPCVILTAYPEQAEEQNLVFERLIFDRNIMETSLESFKSFIESLIQAINVFRNRIELNKKEYKKLLDLYNSGNLVSGKEYEKFEDLFKILKSYGVIDDITIVGINNKFETEVKDLISKIDELLDK